MLPSAHPQQPVSRFIGQLPQSLFVRPGYLWPPALRLHGIQNAMGKFLIP
jgi:hypothetical protein